MRPALRTATAALLLCVALPLSACNDSSEGSTMGDTPSATADGPAALRQRPSLEDQVERLTTMRDEMRSQLAAELKLTSWKGMGDENAAGCEDFPGVGGQTRFLEALLLDSGVPDAQWQDAVQVLARVGARYGFGAPDTVLDTAGRHEVVLKGQYGSLVRFGTQAKATLAVETGCHLPAAKL